VEAAGFEPASGSTPPVRLHAYIVYWISGTGLPTTRLNGAPSPLVSPRRRENPRGASLLNDAFAVAQTYTVKRATCY